MGINNYSYNSDRKPGLFFHDAVTEYNFTPSLNLGAGLTAWSGYARFASPSISTFAGLDAPLFLQATNDVNDQFLRKLSVYSKGDIGKIQYRLVLSKPLDVAKGPAGNTPVGADAQFAKSPSKFQSQGYFQYQFKEKENNLTK